MAAEPPRRATIVEVGPRDGLQNEREPIATEHKRRFIEMLVAAGLTDIEVTSFVHPSRVPQLADASELIASLPRLGAIRYSALVPNEKGLERAVESGISRIAVFTAASETFTQRNIGMTIAQSLEVFREVVRRATSGGLTVRGYVSACFVCPYEGPVAPQRVCEVTEALLAMGVDEVAISDTIGAAVPTDVSRTVGALLQNVTPDRIALHLHDTYGTALANVCAGLELGIATFDASAGGLGGCPFAPGAAGNLATEDLVYLLERMGIATGVDLDKLIEASAYIRGVLGRELSSRNLRRLRPMPAP